ncbi:two-component system response regulator VraR [Faecalicatena contorta]|uniref:response regulator transcription factor n=1 Tax=Faecalicatena contorta TaxID=39482 RepID=UPI0031D1FDC6
MKQVLIVEDQRMSRNYMERILSDSGRYELEASISSAELAIIKCQQQHIDLILMDVCTTGNKDGIDAAAEIKQQFPQVKIIIVTSMVEIGYLERAKAASVDSFWYKDISPESLMEIIDRTMKEESIFPSETPQVKLGLASSSEFTAKEIEVLRLVCDGLEYSEIAEKLHVSVNTVKTHVTHILQRTGYANKTRLAIAVTNKKFIIPNIPDNDEEL